MTIHWRWAVAVTFTSCAALLAYSLAAHGAAGGKPANRGGAGGGGGGRASGGSAGAMRPTAPGGGGASRQPNFNSMAGARPTNGANMSRGGMTGQSAAMRQNNPASRPDLGFGGGQRAVGNALGAQVRQPSAPIANRPSFNASSGQGSGSNLAAANRRDLGGLGPGGLVQAGGGRRPGLAPTIKPADLKLPGSDLAVAQPGTRPAFSGGRPSITGSTGVGSLAGLNRPGGSNIPSTRPDLGGGGLNNRRDIAFKPDISNPNRPDAGILPQPNRPGANRPGQGGGGEQLRPGGGGDNRPSRPGQGGSGEQWRPGWPNRPGGNNNINTGNINSGNINSGNNIWNRTNNQFECQQQPWTSNRQTSSTTARPSSTPGYRPGFAVPGYGYGYQATGATASGASTTTVGNAVRAGCRPMVRCTIIGATVRGTVSGGNANWLNSASGHGLADELDVSVRANTTGVTPPTATRITARCRRPIRSAPRCPYNYSQPINTEARLPRRSKSPRRPPR